MRILVRTPHELPGFSEDPYSFDLLERRPIAENLSWLLKKSEEGLVVALNAAWGEGKTTFLHLWRESLNDDEILIPIYYNAFKHDFSRDAFVSLAATMHRALESEYLADKASRERSDQLRFMKKAAANLAVELAKTSASLAVGSLSGGVLSGAGLGKWLQSAFRKITFGTLEHNADAQFEAYLRADQAVQGYQGAIKRLLEGTAGEKSKKIVVLVDELDRCRPVFAVEVIERVKHLFRSAGVHFVLALHNQQLLGTLRAVYGVAEDDAHVYFQKFIDVEVHLPPLSSAQDTNGLDSKNYLRAAFEQLGLLKDHPELANDLDQVEPLARSLGLNPRALNKMSSYVALALASCGPERAALLRRSIRVSRG